MVAVLLEYRVTPCQHSCVSRKKLLALRAEGQRAKSIHMIDKRQLAEHMLMLNTHNTLHSFDLSIARDHFSILWADGYTICLRVWNERKGLSFMMVRRFLSIGAQ